MSKLVLVFCFCAVALLAFVAPSPDGKFEACSDIAETLPLAPLAMVLVTTKSKQPLTIWHLMLWTRKKFQV